MRKVSETGDDSIFELPTRGYIIYAGTRRPPALACLVKYLLPLSSAAGGY